MSTLLFTAPASKREPVPDELDHAKTTVSTVTDDVPSMIPDAPDTNEKEFDASTDGGLTTHQLGSHVVPSEYYVPQTGDANDWGDAVQGIVNDRISTTGVAAARESAGDWGNGTFAYLVGIEPTIVPGTEFSNVYFDAIDPVIQDGMGAYMTPLRNPDDVVAAETLAQARRNARVARRDQYAAFYNARQAGAV